LISLIEVLWGELLINLERAVRFELTINGFAAHRLWPLGDAREADVRYASACRDVILRTLNLNELVSLVTAS
jgi:hypothetical protein